MAPYYKKVTDYLTSTYSTSHKKKPSLINSKKSSSRFNSTIAGSDFKHVRHGSVPGDFAHDFRQYKVSTDPTPTAIVSKRSTQR